MCEAKCLRCPFLRVSKKKKIQVRGAKKGIMSADLSRVPLAALSAESRHLISTLLNPPKVIPASTGLMRDWRGLAQLCSLGGELLPAISNDPDPTDRIFKIVQSRTEEFSLLELRDALEKIERWDIVDDSREIWERDAVEYSERLQRSQTTAQKNDFSVEKDVLTIDDLLRKERGEQAQHYDAFLLYADEDTKFAMEMLDQLENQHNLKLCLKDRDLVAGISFEHEAIIRLISERCNRLITILSPEFLESPANKFFVNFAQANSIDKQQERKIIPCVYKTCELPPQLTYFSKIYYEKLKPEFFWNRLLGSMKVVPSSTQNSTAKVSKNIAKVNVPNSTAQNRHIEVVNGDRETEPSRQDTVSISSGRISDETKIVYKFSKTFPFVKKKEPQMKPSTSSEGSANEEPIPNMPSLTGLDSLSSDSEPKTKKSKKNKKLGKKIRALMAK